MSIIESGFTNSAQQYWAIKEKDIEVMILRARLGTLTHQDLANKPVITK